MRLRPGGRSGVSEASAWATGVRLELGVAGSEAEPCLMTAAEAAAEAAAEVAAPKGSLPSVLIFSMAARR